MQLSRAPAEMSLCFFAYDKSRGATFNCVTLQNISLRVCWVALEGTDQASSTKAELAVGGCPCVLGGELVRGWGKAEMFTGTLGLQCDKFAHAICSLSCARPETCGGEGDGGRVTCRESALTVSRGEGRMLCLGVVVTKAARWPQWPPALIHISEKASLTLCCCAERVNIQGAVAKNFHFWCHGNGQMEEQVSSFCAAGQPLCLNWNLWSCPKWVKYLFPQNKESNSPQTYLKMSGLFAAYIPKDTKFM